MFEAIAALSPWTIASIGLVLVLLDILLLPTDYLTWIGLALFYTAGVAIFNPSGEVLLLVFTSGTALNLVFLRGIVSHTTRTDDFRPKLGDLVGSSGTVLGVGEDDASTGRAAIVASGEWRVREKNGKALPVKARVRVIGREGMLLIVELAELPTKTPSEDPQ